MPAVSMKKVLIAILVIILLSRLDRVVAFLNSIYEAVYESFEPLRRSPPGGRYVVMLLFLALIYISAFKLLQKRK